MEEKKETTAKPKRTPRAARPKLHRKLTIEQRAEAAALWRAGSVTLDDLSKKFGKRPETFSRLFKQMGIEKGSAAAETAKKMAEAAADAAAAKVSVELQRIQSVKDEHYKFSSSLAKIAMGEIFRARQAGTKIENLRETMLTLKLAGEIVGNSRKELYALLRVEEHDSQAELEDLPELQVTELTQAQIEQMRSADAEDDGVGLGEDPSPLPDPDAEGP